MSVKLQRDSLLVLDAANMNICTGSGHAAVPNDIVIKNSGTDSVCIYGQRAYKNITSSFLMVWAEERR